MVDENTSKENKTEYKEIRKLEDGGEYREKFNGGYAYFYKDGKQVGNFRETRTEGSESVTIEGKKSKSWFKSDEITKKITQNSKGLGTDIVYYKNGDPKTFETTSSDGKVIEKGMIEKGWLFSDDKRFLLEKKELGALEKISRYNKNGDLNGKQETWRDGVQTDYSTFENGKQVGSYKETDYQDKTHYTSHYGNIENGKKILTKQEIQNDDRKEVIPYNKDGDIHGRLYVYDNTDKLVECSEYQNGQRHGKTENYETGEYANYTNGALHGMSGNTKNGDYSRFENGKQVGAYQRTQNSPDGYKTVRIGEVNPNGDDHIQWIKRYYRDNLESSIPYDTDGKKQGTGIENGKAVKYENNNPVSVSEPPAKINSGKYDNNGQLEPGAVKPITNDYSNEEGSFLSIQEKRLDKSGKWIPSEPPHYSFWADDSDTPVKISEETYFNNMPPSAQQLAEKGHIQQTLKNAQVQEQNSPTVNTSTLKKTGQER